MDHQDILSVIRQNRYSLLGEILVSEKERDALRQYVGSRLILAIRRGTFDTRTPDLKFVLGLTQVVNEGYEGSFWDTLADFAKVKDAQGSIKKIEPPLQTMIASHVAETLRYAGLFCLPPEKASQGSDENLRCQALVPDRAMPDWFDLWYEYYCRNLLYCLEDLTDEDLQGIADFMKNTLLGNEHTIQVKMGRKPRTCQMPVAARRVLADCRETSVQAVIMRTLRMLDRYVYFRKLPDPSQPSYGRLECAFVQWAEALGQRTDIPQPVRRQVLNQHVPYLSLDPQSGETRLCIPPQRYPASDGKREITGTLRIRGKDTAFTLPVYSAFGRFITEETSIRLRDPFAEISVRIDGKRCLHLPAQLYRLFHEKDGSMIRCIPAHCGCFLLCHPNAAVSPAQTLEPLALPEQNGFRIRPDMTEEIYVSGRLLPRADRNENQPCHPYVLQTYHAEYAGKQLVCCLTHPVICLTVTAVQLAQSLLEIGDFRWDGSSLERLASETADEPEKRHVELDLSDLVTEDGVYSVHLRRPGQPPELLGRYCLLRSFRIRTKPAYCLPGETLTLALDRSSTTEVTADTTGVFNCRPPMKGAPDIRFDLPVIRWGRSAQEIESCPARVWYQALGTTLCVQMRGVRSMRVCIGAFTAEAVCLDPLHGLYRADLTDALPMLAESPEITVPVILRPVLNGSRGEVPEIRLFSVIRRTYTVPEPVLERTPEGGVMLGFDALVGENDLYMDIRDAKTGVLCAEQIKLQAGQIRLEGLDPSGTYTLHRFMLENRNAAETVRVEYPVIECRCMDPDDPRDTVYRLSEILADGEVQVPAAEVRVVLEEQCGEDTYRGEISYRWQKDPAYTKLGNAHRFCITQREGTGCTVQMLPADSDFNSICLMHATMMLLRKSAPALRGCDPGDYTCLNDEGVILRLIPDTGNTLEP